MNRPAAPASVVMFSTADWDTPYWTNKQHMARRLASRGTEVLYVESVGLRRPTVNPADLRRVLRRLSRGLRRPRRVENHLWVVSPLTLPMGQRYAPVRAFNAAALRFVLSSWLKRRGGQRPVVWTYHPYVSQAIAGLDTECLVYHCVDNLAAVPGIDAQAFRAAEDILLAKADVVFATSPALHEHCSRIAAGRTYESSNVADLEMFGRARDPGPIPEDLARVARPRLGYMGKLSDYKVDFALCESIARARPDWHLVFIGDEREGQHDAQLLRLRAMDNVHFLGWRAYSSIPDYLRGIDVGLIPLQMNSYTRSMFPMKFFEYLCAGRPVVATNLPSLAQFHDCCYLGGEAGELIGYIAQALEAPLRRVLPLDHEVLLSHTWDARLDRMLRVLSQSRLGADKSPQERYRAAVHEA